MAIKIPGLKIFTAGDAKSRVFIILAAVLVVGLALYLAVRFFTGGGETTGQSRVATPPSGLQSVPGAQMTPEFYRAVVEANKQAATQAQITGGSAVPTLINVPGQQPGVDCTIVCPNDDNVDVSNDINNLIKTGKLAQDDANRLLDLTKANASPDEFAAMLADLVRQGKLTPEQARLLLQQYKKQHQNTLATESGKMMDGLIKANQLPLDSATELLLLQKNRITPAEYGAELNRLVRDGKISPQTAGNLLTQYTQQQAKECQKDSIFNLRQMQKAGQITPEVMQSLIDLQSKSVPAAQYAAEINKLLAAGKMTPEVAAKLIDMYKQRCAGLGSLEELNSLVAAQEAKCASQLRDMAVKNKWPQETLNNLTSMQQKKVTSQAFQAAITQLQQQNRITPEDARNLISCYQILSDLRAMAQRLMDLQNNNASADEYSEELKRAVQAGLLSPEDAARLLAAYRSLTIPATQGALPGVDTNIPGGEEFARLQQRLGQEQTAPTAAGSAEAAQQFAAAQAQAQAQAQAAAMEARQARIQALMQAMSTQAQTLIAAWQPPVMQRTMGQNETAREKAAAKEIEAGIIPGSRTTVVPTARPRLMPPLIKAGTILFAILDTAVNSDFPDTPVMATIVQGKFKGARLLGKLNLAEGQDKVSLVFSLMDRDDWLQTKPVNAFAIDPDTARTVMASSVDRHYLLRYGSLIASNLLAGYASAIMASGSVQTNNANGSTVTRSQFSPREKIAVAFGKVGDALANAVAPWFNTPTTVVVNSGVGLGILFVADVPAEDVAPAAGPGPAGIQPAKLMG